MKYLYLHGFASSPRSGKARYFAQRFAELGLSLEIPELAPDFENMTISSQIDIVERAAAGADEITLFGSSMGGYVAALSAALGRIPVSRLVLMAPAFGLSQRWADALGGPRLDEWRTTGRLSVFHYGDMRQRDLGYRFVTDAAAYPDYPHPDQPVLLLHGRGDDVVPLAHSERFAALRPNRKLVVFDSGHELTDVLPALWQESKNFLGL